MRPKEWSNYKDHKDAENAAAVSLKELFESKRTAG